MHKIFINTVMALSAFLMVSCGFLDIVPDNVATIDNAFTLRTNAEKYIRGKLNKALSDTRTSATLKIKTDGGLFSKMQAPDGSREGGGVLARPQTPTPAITALLAETH